MPNLFDNLQQAMFASIANTMGYRASWAPAAGGQTQTAQVLYKGPTEKQKLLQADYDPDQRVLEYQEGDFPTLYDIINASGNSEVITIEGIGPFYCSSISKKYDGRTYEVNLQAKLD